MRIDGQNKNVCEFAIILRNEEVTKLNNFEEFEAGFLLLLFLFSIILACFLMWNYVIYFSATLRQKCPRENWTVLGSSQTNI